MPAFQLSHSCERSAHETAGASTQLSSFQNARRNKLFQVPSMPGTVSDRRKLVVTRLLPMAWYEDQHQEWHSSTRAGSDCLDGLANAGIKIPFHDSSDQEVKFVLREFSPTQKDRKILRSEVNWHQIRWVIRRGARSL